ncbi:unnamed protein product [Rhizoctonia solani]|uniref:Uncharacterized protein n=1 Tax=Rhizoctonia solani TaxID=456999 RepID=A0A8H3BNX5_9AGAM|nr:unnamed protein product [Rhizoctonia solani]CAE6517033.1 unnamed protein product [Rhizoctonia solani]
MRFTIWAGYLTDSHLFDQWCITREATDPLFLKCRKDCYGFNEHAMETYAKRMKLPWRKKISIDYLPYPKESLGAVESTRRYTIFAFRDYEITGSLLRFSSWRQYQETDRDREYKSQIEELLGFELGAWTVVSSIGHQGLFYNFSAETKPAIIDFIRQRAQMKRDAIAELKAKEEGKDKTEGAVACNSVQIPGAVD